ncbi:uncharacterized protein LOC143206604 [Rhynchophorus ferrugineus]|uniref:Protein sleepless n=1 Tax=Rhynchophorus ferrugineus TaxID=354439 RepID=A0A834HNA2_RHYFE|nr:hypothetical protein GWI33_023152 [Rhynchophorus ferrugineus]KAF7264485.1 hypothetical protein GWI33_023150 [Rhynchophorus ferrugineus]
MSHHLFLILSVIVVSLKYGTALNCYDCTGRTNTSSNCENNLSSVKKQNCTTGLVCAYYIIENNSYSTITRSCSSPDVCSRLENQNSHILGHNNTVKYCKTCNSTDYCNSAVSIQTSNVFFIIPAIVYMLSKFV